MYTIGVDLGGTNVRAAVVDTNNGRVMAVEKEPTLAREGVEAVLTRMAGVIERIIREAEIGRETVRGVGIGVPGMLDPKSGVVWLLPNFPGRWSGVPVAAEIERRVGLPVRLINDARAMAYGEWAFGAGEGVQNMACLTLGTGVGGGLVLGGRLHLGINGTAGEVGHQVVEPHGLPCGCGGRGCLEVYASGPAIAAMAVRAVMQGSTTLIGGLAGYDLNRITPEMVYQAASQGDAVAREIYERAGFYLGLGISNLMICYGPQKVVLGGGVAQAGELLFAPVRRVVTERVHLMPREKVAIVPAALGLQAGLIGAALWAAAP